MKNLTLVLPYFENSLFEQTYLDACQLLGEENCLVTYFGDKKPSCKAPTLKVNHIKDAASLKNIFSNIQTEFTCLVTEICGLEFLKSTFLRLTNIAQSSKVNFVYSDYINVNEKNEISANPLCDYQIGSVRDDFSFGPLILIKTSSAQAILNSQDFTKSTTAALYELRLMLSLDSLPIRLNEPLYSKIALKESQSYEKEMFSYVDASNRQQQIDLEESFTKYAKNAGFYLEPRSKKIEFKNAQFPVQMSVIIPVKNRKNTVKDAIQSALSQKTNFKFNVIVVDNHSNDGTSEIIAQIAAQDSRLVHIQPQTKLLGIGGCWNEAIHSKHCGQFVCQLDSDDLYIDQNTLAKVNEIFEKEGCATVVGSYSLVDFDLKSIPPGLIDHKEWTDTNGHNNGLRINGFGAPRAFYTPLIREFNFPNTSYGEDYAMMLRFTREYKLGRIYDSLYLCRRWGGNSESNINLEQINRNNSYKDKLRTVEILARREMVVT